MAKFTINGDIPAQGTAKMTAVFKTVEAAGYKFEGEFVNFYVSEYAEDHFRPVFSVRADNVFSIEKTEE